MEKHKSVLAQEIIENLNIDPNGVYFDLTLGAGGHSKAIYENLEAGMLISFDVDPDAIKKYQEFVGGNWHLDQGVYLLEDAGKEHYIVHKSFEKLTEVVNQLDLENKVDGIIADLGWASEQLETVPGLSYKTNTALDMRLDPSLQVTASDLLTALYRKELLELFQHNADLYGSRLNRLVTEIIKFRETDSITTTFDLLQIIFMAAGQNARPLATHPNGSQSDSQIQERLMQFLRNPRTGDLPARVFQALRIAVNQELSTLQSVMPQAWSALKAGGVMEIITFHSGEDKLVKRQFDRWVSKGRAEQLFEQDYLHPGVEELTENLRARSAKLRGIVKNQ